MPPRPSASTSDDAFVGSFMQLVDAWLEAHPVHTHALSSNSIKLAAAKLLLLQSGKASQLDWPGADATRLVGILMVLFVHEGLAVSGELDDRQILGLPMADLFEVIENIINLKKITREELVAAVLDEDLEGTALPLVQSYALTSALFTKAAPAARQARYFLRLRTLLIVIFGAALLSSDHVAQLAGMLLPDTMRLLGRSTFSAFCLTLGVLSVAVVFPSDIQSPTSSRRYVLPLTICTSVVTVGNAMRALINVEHINDSCRFVHVLLCVGVVLNAIVCIVWLGLMRFRWATARSVLIADGLIYISSAIALRAVGPPKDGLYPSGNVPFWHSVGNALWSILLGSALSEGNRHRLKGMLEGTWTGWEPLADSLVDTLQPHENGHVAETAMIDDNNSPYKRMMRRQLAGRHLMVRLLLVMMAVAWFYLNHLFLNYQWHLLSIIMIGSMLSISAFFVAASFPTDLNSPAGRTLLLPASLACALAAATAAYLSMTRDGVMSPLNDACRIVYRIFFLAVVLNWWGAALLCVRHQFTWAVARAIVLIDSFTFFFVTLAMRQLGPPPSYPPDNVSFQLAMLRGAVTLFIAISLSPANRLRAAAAANQLGWNHVTLSLHQLHRKDARRVRFADPNKPEGEAEGGGNSALGGSEMDTYSTTHGDTRSVNTASYSTSDRAEMLKAHED